MQEIVEGLEKRVQIFIRTGSFTTENPGRTMQSMELHVPDMLLQSVHHSVGETEANPPFHDEI